MASISQSGSFTLGDRTVKRLGYGAMQLAGPGVFGPPKDRDAALAVLREAVASGIDHIDTSDFYGPHVTNQLIREALQPYPEDLVIVTKIGARRGEDGSWLPAFSPDELTRRCTTTCAIWAGRARGGQSSRHVRHPRPGGRIDRGAADRAGRTTAAGAGPSHWPEQCDAQRRSRKRVGIARSSVCRTSTISPIAATMR